MSYTDFLLRELLWLMYEDVTKHNSVIMTKDTYFQQLDKKYENKKELKQCQEKAKQQLPQAKKQKK